MEHENRMDKLDWAPAWIEFIFFLLISLLLLVW